MIISWPMFVGFDRISFPLDIKWLASQLNWFIGQKAESLADFSYDHNYFGPLQANLGV